MKLEKNVLKNPYRIMCFSDIHGNLQLLKAIVKESKRLKVDEVICLGDVVSKGPNSNECVDLIRENGITYLMGNNEYFLFNEPKKETKTKEELEHLEWLKNTISNDNLNFIKKLPNRYIINFKEKNMQFAHFLFKNSNEFLTAKYFLNNGIDDLIQKENNYNYVFFGHIHSASLNVFDDKSFIGIGSGACTGKSPGYYILLEYDKGHLTFQELKLKYNFKKFKNTIKKSNYPGAKTYLSDVFHIK